jgi:hypothetical protein
VEMLMWPVTTWYYYPLYGQPCRDLKDDEHLYVDLSEDS